MAFLQHLQSSLILGTKMTHPEDEHFVAQQCKELFAYIDMEQTSNLKNLIEAGVDPERCECQHLRPLSYAIKNKKIKSIQSLLTYGSNPNHKDRFGRIPLDYALQTEHPEIIDLLLRYGAHSKEEVTANFHSYDNISDVYEAALVGNLHALTHYHLLGASLTKTKSNRTSLLHLCIEGNNPKLLIYLLNKGLNIDSADTSGTSALILAVMDISRYKLVEILVKRNATLEQRNNRQVSALTMAIKRFNIKAAALLINKGADVNIRDGADTPLTLVHKALSQVNDKELQQKLRDLETLLLSKGAHVNSVDEKLLWSPLMLTSSHYHDKRSEEHLKLLIKLGAKVDQKDKNKRTALMIASSLGRTEALESLIKYGANMNLSDKFGWTALMLAVYYNQKEIVKLLLENGCDVNFSTKKGLSALKVAIDNDRAALIPILKDYGAVFPKE